MITEQQIVEIVNEKLEGSDLFLVEVSVDSANRIRIEVDRNEGVSIENCMKVSRHVESTLDREVEDFELQVSSPGLDKGFKVFKQYLKNVGKQVEVKKKGGEKLKGLLLEVKEEGVILETKRKERIEGKKKKQVITEQLDIKFNDIEETKIIILFK